MGFVDAVLLEPFGDPLEYLIDPAPVLKLIYAGQAQRMNFGRAPIAAIGKKLVDPGERRVDLTLIVQAVYILAMQVDVTGVLIDEFSKQHECLWSAVGVLQGVNHQLLPVLEGKQMFIGTLMDRLGDC